MYQGTVGRLDMLDHSECWQVRNFASLLAEALRCPRTPTLIRQVLVGGCMPHTATVITVEPVSGNRSTRRNLKRTELHNHAWVKVFDPRCRTGAMQDPASELLKIYLPKPSEKSLKCPWTNLTGSQEAHFWPISCSACWPNSRLERCSNTF